MTPPNSFSISKLKNLIKKPNEKYMEKLSNLVNSYREEGKKLFGQRKYFEALVSYNKSLCHAKNISTDMSDIYADRSEVYFKLKQYQNCLENIKLSSGKRNFELDAELNDRENSCQQILKNKKASDLQSFFKLSSPANHRLPFIAKCLKLGENEKFGRFIFTNENLRPGHVIAIEEPFFNFVDSQTKLFYKYRRCFNCFKSNHLNLLPGPHSGKENKNLVLFSMQIA